MRWRDPFTLVSHTRLGSELIRQLGLPRGLLGRYVGRRLARQNADLTRWVIAQLDPGPAHAVLEVGCGPAMGVPDVLRRCGGGGYDGVDLSPTMIAVASRRNRRAVAAGRARFHLCPVDALPFPDSRFDGAFGVNVIYFWDDPQVELAELRRVLAPGATLAIGIRPRSGIPDEFLQRFEEPGHRTYEADEVAALLEAAGFTDVRAVVADDGYAAILGSA